MPQLRVAPNTGNEFLIGPDQISNARFRKTHTGASIFNATVEAGLNLQDRTLDELWLEKDDGSLLFRGQLQRVNNRRGQGIAPTTDIKGHGVSYKLERSETVFTVENELAHSAIDRFWADETSFSPTVTTPSINNTVTAEVAQEADTNAEFNQIVNIDETTPVGVQNNGLELLQSAVFARTDDLEGGDVEVTDPNLTDENWESADVFEYDVANPLEATLVNTLNYTIPEDNVGVLVRLEGNWENGIQATLNGDELYSNNGLSVGTDIGWFLLTPDAGNLSGPYTDISGASSVRYNGGDLQVGEQFSLDFNANGDPTGGNTAYLDCIYLFDDRFEYTIDNTIDSGSLALDGPQEHPPEQEVRLTTATTSWNVTDATLDVSMTDTGGTQRIQLRLSDQTWFPNDGSENNTTSVTTGFGSEVGSEIQGRVRLSRFDSGNNDSPLTGDSGQTVTDCQISFDGNDIPVFSGSNTFEGSRFEVAQRLHNQARMRFTLEHSKTDLPVESYRPEDNIKTLPELTIASRTSRKDEQDFANHVTVRGQRVDGTRLSHTVQDDDSVAARGIEHFDVKDPSLDDLTAIKVVARTTLVEKLREQTQKGDLEIAPENIPAGYGRPNPFDSDDDAIPIEETSYEIRQGEIRGNLTFDFRTGQQLAENQSTVRQSTQNNALGF